MISIVVTITIIHCLVFSSLVNNATDVQTFNPDFLTSDCVKNSLPVDGS